MNVVDFQAMGLPLPDLDGIGLRNLRGVELTSTSGDEIVHYNPPMPPTFYDDYEDLSEEEKTTAWISHRSAYDRWSKTGGTTIVKTRPDVVLAVFTCENGMLEAVLVEAEKRWHVTAYSVQEQR